MKKVFLLLCMIVLLSVPACCWAENVRGDLNERFGNVPSVEYGGVSYVRRGGQSAMLVLTKENGSLNRVLVLNSDDTEKNLYLLNFDCAAEKAYLPGEDPVSLGNVFQNAGDDARAAEMLRDILNTVLPLSPVEGYMVLDMSVLDEMSAISPDMPAVDALSFEEKAALLKDQLGQKSSSDLNTILPVIAEYITTDMKSGAVMKVINKVKKYDIQPMVEFSADWTWNSESSVQYEEEHLKPLIGVFLSEKKVW